MVSETDFERIAEELRRASQEAKKAAELNPEHSVQLRAKARKLLLAAERIEADARGREGFIVVNHGHPAARNL